MDIDDTGEDEVARPSNESMEVDSLVQSRSENAAAPGPSAVDLTDLTDLTGDDVEASGVNSEYVYNNSHAFHANTRTATQYRIRHTFLLLDPTQLML
jgi:hypothetical protein